MERSVKFDMLFAKLFDNPVSGYDFKHYQDDKNRAADSMDNPDEHKIPSCFAIYRTADKRLRR